ncbi:ABC transporter substrate-binding protein [Luteimonas deserti]|uniref:Thiamine pyrimidine synthase n=1 Tax=Luteimonas deserti TaxID=2752306 RepID=A0A7Z0QR77_9GAMM|nr:ABC transporter substrate-binding protein [Luteimonas deserti]NYZ63223.1 ABC transporter substrate-binding protein [Luteimonas deserti]
MKLQLSLEWFLNPDHLPLIAGIERGWYRDAGIELELLVPDDHYDGLAAVVEGEIAFACNEPLHMIDAHRPGLRALGCFFETEGGILLKREAGARLLAGGAVRLASPVAGGVTDAIAVEILSRWCTAQGASFGATQVRIESAGFEHLANLRAGYDGAWLCFANFEGVEARLAGMDTRFIATHDVGMHNFSALELFTSQRFMAEHPDVVDTVTRLVGQGARLCRDDPAEAAALWYRYSRTEPTALMDAIVADTCPRLVGPVRRDAARWQGMWQQFEALGLSQVDRTGYEALYA